MILRSLINTKYDFFKSFFFLPQIHMSWSKSGPPTKASLPTLQSWWRLCHLGSGPVPIWRSCGWGRPWRTRTAGWGHSWPACAQTLLPCWTLPTSPHPSWCSVVCCGEKTAKIQNKFALHTDTVCRFQWWGSPVWSKLKGSKDLLRQDWSVPGNCNTVNLLCFASGLCYIGQE